MATAKELSKLMHAAEYSRRHPRKDRAKRPPSRWDGERSNGRVRQIG